MNNQSTLFPPVYRQVKLLKKMWMKQKPSEEKDMMIKAFNETLQQLELEANLAYADNGIDEENE